VVAYNKICFTHQKFKAFVLNAVGVKVRILINRDAPDILSDNPAFFDIRYPSGYRIALPDIRYPAFGLDGYPAGWISSKNRIRCIPTE
jgi:hypothetical protein